MQWIILPVINRIDCLQSNKLHVFHELYLVNLDRIVFDMKRKT